MRDNKIDLFKSKFPGAHYFDEHSLQMLPQYLRQKGLISHQEPVLSVEKPGEGNMNFVRRVTTDKQSFILKQCRPWVEKYPQIEAPVERMDVEANYYRFISGDPLLESYSPKLILHDPDNLILITEDLGHSSDFTFCYKKTAGILEEQIASLLKYISHLHAKDWENQSILFPGNLALRQLNHEHIFVYPYMLDNGFDLDSVQPGLQQLSLPIKKDDMLKRNIKELGKSYLAAGPVLIHGDYYPGSWLLVDREVKVIDPEFAFFGFAEFDLGVMMAHLFMSGMNEREVQHILSHYNGSPEFDHDLHLRFCGVEILRRIIGLAQLPLEFTLTEKKELIDLAVDLVNSPETHHFFTYEMD